MAREKKKREQLTGDETRFYAMLRELAGRDAALKFFWLVISTRPAISGPDPQVWLVPSTSEAGRFYEVDIDLRICLCDGFNFKHRCSHLAVADRAARLRYELVNPFQVKGQRQAA
jgi:hypothetical protein